MDTLAARTRAMPPERQAIRARTFFVLLLTLLAFMTGIPAIMTYNQLVEIHSQLDSLEKKVLSDLPDKARATDSRDSFETLKAEIVQAYDGYYLIVAMFIVGTTIVALLLRKHFLHPVFLLAEKMRLMQLGYRVENASSSRIVELQEVLDIVAQVDEYLIELAEYSDKLTQEKSRLEDMSMKDSLTGIANRRSFDVRLNRKQRGDSIGILMIDVDEFKNYNDNLGHQAGDACLVKLASAMQAALLRSSDVLFRYGGEEFVVILENVDSGQAIEVSERIQARVRSLHLPHPLANASPYVTISIGAAVTRQEGFTSCEELVRQADKALYRAKRSGRNRICLYNKKLDGECVGPNESS
ncbi:MAG: GGDEF domain-containing protein [Desulfovibrio sp.]|nr:GGDEF domain-containing protein [Desulfovibrio sp.]